MKPFNLEDAKAGKPFTHVNDPLKRPYYFVGVSTIGRIVVEVEQGQRFLDYEPEDLRMIPEKKTTVVYLIRNKENGVVFSSDYGPANSRYELLGEHLFEYED